MITIVSTWVNHPEVLKIHRDLWSAAFNESVRYVAYIDAKEYADFSNFGDTTMRQQLVQACINNSIEYVLVPEEYHVQRDRVFLNCKILADQTPSGRNSLVCQYVWKKEVLEGSVDQLVLVQSDIFPYRRFTWNSIMRGADFYYRPQQRTDNGITVHYAWEGLCFFDTRTWTLDRKRLVSFEYAFQNSVFTDTGGGLWVLLNCLEENQKFGFQEFDSNRWSSDMTLDLPYWVEQQLLIDPRNRIDESGTAWYYSELFDQTFFHLRAGGNWDCVGKEMHDIRYSNFTRLLTDAIDDGTVFI